MVGNSSSASVGVVVSVAVVRLAHPAGGGAGGHEGLLVDAAGNLAHAGDGADGRRRGEPPADLALGLVGHQVAAVGGDRQRLPLDAAQRLLGAAAHIGLEGRLVLDRVCRQRLAVAAEQRPAGLQHQRIHQPLLLVERAVDAVDLLDGQHVGDALLLDLGEAGVVLRLERLEGPHEVFERPGDIAGRLRGLGLGRGHGFSLHASPSC